MIAFWILLALFAAGEEGSGQDLFQISFLSGGVILAQEAPVEKGGRLVFRRHPDGVLFSARKSEVAGIARVRFKPQSRSRPGEQIDVGSTGEGGPRTEPKTEPSSVRPIWEYRSLSGRRLIVGYNVPFPPAPAAQRAPGEPPTGGQSGLPPTRPD